MENHKRQLAEASDAFSREDYEKALSILCPLAEANVGEALGLLGVMYQLGLGVELDGPKAVELLTKAMDLGVGVAAHNLGTIYGMGLPGVPSDRALSRWHYGRAKDLGAQFAPDSFYE